MLAAVVSIVLGMGMPTVGVYVLLAALVAPALVKVGLSPMAAHMFVMYFGMMSMITPPVALAAFAAASLAQTDPMKTGWAAVRFGWIAYIIPFLFVRAPSLLLEGTLTSVVIAFVTALAGVWLICAAFAGYSTRPLTLPMRIGFGIAGLLLFIPADAMKYGELTDIAGLALGAVLLARELLAVRTAPADGLSVGAAWHSLAWPHDCAQVSPPCCGSALLLAASPAQAGADALQPHQLPGGPAIGLAKQRERLDARLVPLDPGECRRCSTARSMPIWSMCMRARRRSMAARPLPESGQAELCVRDGNFQIANARNCPLEPATALLAARPSDAPNGSDDQSRRGSRL